MREADVERYLVKVIRSRGGDCRKVKWIGRTGAPDRVVMLPRTDALFEHVGGTFWVELKAPGEKPTRAQLREHARMRKLGQQVFVFNSIGAIDKWAASL